MLTKEHLWAIHHIASRIKKNKLFEEIDNGLSIGSFRATPAMCKRLNDNKDSPVKLSVEMLRAHLLSGNRKSYDHFKDFRRSVLEPAICEINETGLYHISMEACYTGRRISHVLFHMEKLMPEEDAVHLVDTSNNTTK